MTIHEDDRRILYDWANGDFKSAKAIEIKSDFVIIGGHSHRSKDELFFLMKGSISVLEVGGEASYNVNAPKEIFIPRGIYHRFVCREGTILLCAATEMYDQNDEIK